MSEPLANVFQTVGMVAAIVLPVWNIPLILRIIQRKSSSDVSMWWTFGALTCFLLMFPSALMSDDLVFKVFSIVNVFFFSIVAFTVVKYR
jgi:uncharacterized protein with PQ loop repeat